MTPKTRDADVTGAGAVPDRGAVGTRQMQRIEAARTQTVTDTILIEAPLEIRWAGDTLATTMRTPGRDHDLALGFLRSEGLIDSVNDVGTVAHCGRPGDPGFGNIIDISPGPGVVIDPEARIRRGTLVSSACGVCGRQSIDDLLARIEVVTRNPRISIRILHQCLEQLRAHQALFDATGGSHGAALFASDGNLLAVGEDVGRHNAVDKLIGARLRETGAEPPPDVLAVSGRLSFEMVQKAAVSGVAIVASVSAASSLAIDLADQAGLTAVGFVRDARANVYTHAHRILETNSK